MPGRILVVDDILSNVKLLEAKLSAERFEVFGATSGQECLQSIPSVKPDIILLDVMMPGMDGFEVCHRIKSNSETAHLPVIMVTALDQPSDRVAALERGADEFLIKPVDDDLLFALIRNKLRWVRSVHELRRHFSSYPDALSLANQALTEVSPVGRILIIEDRDESISWMASSLDNYECSFLPDATHAVNEAHSTHCDLVILSMGLRNSDSIKLCADLQSKRDRLAPTLSLFSDGQRRDVVRCLEMGIWGFMSRPVDKFELKARALNIIRRKHYIERLRQSPLFLEGRPKFARPVGISGVAAARALSQQDPLGAQAELREDRLSLVLPGDSTSDFPPSSAELFKSEAIRKVDILRKKLSRLSNHPGWTDLITTADLFAKEIDQPVSQYSARSMLLWSLSVSLASFLEQNRSAKEDNTCIKTAEKTAFGRFTLSKCWSPGFL